MLERVVAAKRALLFTQQTVGLGLRKTGMVYWAETLAKMGWHTDVVTVQLSRLTALMNPERFLAYPREAINRWSDRGHNLRGFIWVPPVHPLKLPRGAGLATLAAARVYAAMLPGTILGPAARADLIVIESTVAVALFDRLKRAAPRARFVYCASDRLIPIGMAPTLQKMLQKSAAAYDLIRVPAASMIGDFPPDAKVLHIPHGIDRSAFSQRGPSPYRAGSRNLVVAGDTAFDPRAVRAVAERLPECTVHLFGRMAHAGLDHLPNLIFHGEVPFAALVPFLQHADIGLSPYGYLQDRNYLAESSLKQLQYRLCCLSIVLPSFAAPVPQPHHFVYDGDDPAAAGEAALRALAYDRHAAPPAEILDWWDVVERVIAAAGLPS
jgi:2-beta-glucuronyltransferase